MASMVAPRDARRRHVPFSSTHNPNLRRRRTRLAVAVPAAVVAWGLLAGLPLGADPARPGEMHTEIISLTGADAAPTAATAADGAAVRSAAPATASAGWSAGVDVDDGTQAVAASWLGAAEGAVEVRGRAGESWTAWTELAAEVEETPDDTERTSGGMAWFGTTGVDEVEIRVAAGRLTDLEIQPMRYEEPSTGSTFSSATAGADAAQPTILPRSSYTSKGWASSNPGCSSGPTTAAGGVKFAVVHHTVNSNTYAAADVPAMLAAIYTYHTGTNRWCDTGYNFLVDRFGRIWEGRSGGIDKAIVGGHAAGFNTGSVGVSFLGQFEPGASPTAVAPTPAALAAAGTLLGWKLGSAGIDPTGTVAITSGGSNKYPAGTNLTIPRIIGHRDVGLTACPGEYLYSQLATIRTAAKSAQGGTTTTTAPTTTTTTPPTPVGPFSSSWAFVAQQYRDLLRREATTDDLSYWSSRVGSSWTPGQFIAHLTASTEADNRVHAVTRLYRAYFLRNPDHNGLTYWLNRRGEGRSLVSISSSFAVSSEFTNRYGKLTNRAFVDRVYRNVLGRGADASGLTYWTTRLDGGMSRGQVMANFSQSSEYVRNTAASVWVVGVYEGMLRRAPEADVFTLFSTGIANEQTTLTSVATFVFESSEYRTRFGS